MSITKTTAVIIYLVAQVSVVAQVPNDAGNSTATFEPLVQQISEHLDGETRAALSGLEASAASADWTRVKNKADKLGARLAKRGHRDATVFGLVAAYRAVAAASLGNRSEAEWEWQVALNLLQGVATRDLESALRIAPLLADFEMPPLHQTGGGNLRRRPEIRNAVAPTFLLGPSDSRRAPFAVTVQIVIGTDGSPSHPRVLLPESGALRENGDRIYSGLESVRRFRFAPILDDGTAVEWPYAVNLSYGLAGKRPSGSKRLQ